MSDISIGGAVFAGVNAIRQRPATLVIWYVIMVLVAALSFAAMSDLIGPALADMQALQAAGPQADPTQILAVTGRVMRGYLVLAPLSLIIGAITTGAATRAIVRPEDRGLGYFKLTSDELRLVVVLLVIGLILLGIAVAGILLAGLLAGIMAGATGGPPDPNKLRPFVFIGFLPALILMIFMGVKLSLAPAQTVDSRAINIFGSWTLTKGRFWPIFATYLLGGIIYFVILIAMMLLIGAAAKGMGAAINGPVMQPDVTSPSNLTKPPMIVYLLGMAVTQVASLIFVVCPGAAIYQQLAGRADEEAF
jgi:hypothetical protein